MLKGRNKQEAEAKMKAARIVLTLLSSLLALPATADGFKQARGVICRNLEATEVYRSKVMQRQNMTDALLAANTIKENGVGSCQYATFVGRLGDDLLPIMDDYNRAHVITEVTVIGIVIGIGVAYDFPPEDRRWYTVRILEGQAL